MALFWRTDTINLSTFFNKFYCFQFGSIYLQEFVSYRSDPKSLNILDRSQISWVISLFLKLRPCMPCLWNANTLSARQTRNRKGEIQLSLKSRLVCSVLAQDWSWIFTEKNKSKIELKDWSWISAYQPRGECGSALRTLSWLDVMSQSELTT